jgi:hypothetical protein
MLPPVAQLPSVRANEVRWSASVMKSRTAGTASFLACSCLLLAVATNSPAKDFHLRSSAHPRHISRERDSRSLVGFHLPETSVGDKSGSASHMGKLCPFYTPEVPAVPFKTNADRRHHISKQRYRVYRPRYWLASSRPDSAHQWTEAKIGCNVLNRMTQLRMPVPGRIV